VAGYEAVNFIRCVTSGVTGNPSYVVLAQLVEDVRTLAGQTVTVSFWAKAGSGTPSVSSEIVLNYGSGGSTRETLAVSVKKYAINTSWARYSFSFTMPSMSGKTIGAGSYTEFYIWLSAGSDYNSRTDTLGIQNNTFDIWGCQWEAGSVATPFTTATGTIQGELAACQRYYAKSYNLDTAPGTNTNDGLIYSGINAVGTTTGYLGAQIFFPVRMRTSPTITTYDVAENLNKISRIQPAVADENNISYSTAFTNETTVAIQSASGAARSGIAFHYTASAEL
jgi:hypothetical protein